MDTVNAATRSRIMSRIRGKDTKPELLLRRALHARGIRYRVHDRSVPGTPDISHKSAKVAVFVDGCFWHGCPEHYRRPSSRQDFWDAKLRYNRDLRARATANLSQLDWRIFTFWECELKTPESACSGIMEAIRAARRADRRAFR